MDKSVLTGHTALCLVTLVGFFIYTSSYSLVYHVFKTGSTVKPIAVLELWMIFVHLLISAITCTVYAMFNLQCAEIQTSIFLGVALAVTVCSVACINNDLNQQACIIFFPAAAWAPLAAAGSIAWSWIVYIASLGCQASNVTLGTSTNHLISPIILALVSPSISATLKQTCGIGAQPLIALGLHITLLLLTFFIWNISHFVEPMASKAFMRILAIVLLIVDVFVIFQGGIGAWICLILVLIALSDGQISLILFGSASPFFNRNSQTIHQKPQANNKSGNIMTSNSISMVTNTATKRPLHRQ